MEWAEQTLERFDLRSLHVFVNVVDAGSLTAGASRCALSLPAVSKRIGDLEEQMGVQLLSRSKAGIVPTAAGLTLYQHAVQVGAEMTQLSQAMSDYRQNVQDHLRVCANTSAVTGFLPAFLSQYLRVRPEVKVDLEELNSEPLVRAVSAGSAELGIFGSNVSSGDLATATCDIDRLVLVTPRSHVLTRRDQVTWAQALAHDFVGLNRGSSLSRLMDAESARVNVPLKLRVRVKSFDAVCQMVAMGLGLGLLPLSASKTPSRALPITLVPLDELWARNRELLVGWRKDTPLGPSARLFLNMLLERGRNTQAAVGAITDPER
jgi:DNA-binding transcriptional LysR family regulator